MNTEKDPNEALNKTDVTSCVLFGDAKRHFDDQICEILNKKYETKKPLTDFKKAVEWIEESSFLIRKPHYLLFFEEKGIVITAIPQYDGEFFLEMFELQVLNNGKGIFTDTLFKDSEHAIQDGIKKACELYNLRFV
jgi:hypothetical protein